MTPSKTILFRGLSILTPDADRGVRYLQNGFIAVSGDRIAYVGDNEESALSALNGRPDETRHAGGRMAMPAFANAHCHAAMVLMRNAADDRNLHDWLFDMIFPMEERLRREDVYNGSMLGIAQMIRGGIGACADMYYHPEAVVEAAATAGIRMNLCCEAKESDPSGRGMRMRPDRLEEFARLCRSTASGRIRPSLVIHSVYLYDAEVYPALSEMALSAGIPIHTHLSETAKEVEDCIAKYGCRPVEQMDRFGIFRVPCIAAHAVHLDDRDRRILASRPVTLVHNPSSNMKLGSGMADVCSMLDCGIPVALGTDGAASNNALDLFREMRLAAMIAKCRSFDASALPAQEVFRMATRTGMQAMGFNESGILAAGMKADLQLVDTTDVSLCPLGDPVSAVVYSAGSEIVDSLMVDGRMLMSRRELLTIDEERVRYEALRSAAHVTGRRGNGDGS